VEILHVVLAEEREIRFGLREVGRVVQVDRRPLGGQYRGPLGVGELGLRGRATAPSFMSAWSRTTSSRRGCMVRAAMPSRRTP